MDIKNVINIKKKHKINIIYEDLTYTNMYIFNLAKNYNNILILEDDFIFANIILNKTVLKDVNNFIIKKNQIFIISEQCHLV
jgi:hypothetical protein